MKTLNIKEITEYLANEPLESNVYIGVDSERYKDKGKWFADYTVAVVIHRNGNNGCKVFGGIDTA
jgi:hypothetical protein